jgi:hypothetical protein
MPLHIPLLILTSLREVINMSTLISSQIRSNKAHTDELWASTHFWPFKVSIRKKQTNHELLPELLQFVGI